MHVLISARDEVHVLISARDEVHVLISARDEAHVLISARDEVHVLISARDEVHVKIILWLLIWSVQKRHLRDITFLTLYPIKFLFFVEIFCVVDDHPNYDGFFLEKSIGKTVK